MGHAREERIEQIRRLGQGGRKSRRNDPAYARLDIPWPDEMSVVLNSEYPIFPQVAEGDGDERCRGYWSVHGRAHLDFDIDLQDGKVHRLTIYNRAPGNHGTATIIELIDATTQKTLDTVEIVESDMQVCRHVAWDVAGHIVMRLRAAGQGAKQQHGVHGGAGAHIQAIFFDPPRDVPLPQTDPDSELLKALEGETGDD